MVIEVRRGSANGDKNQVHIQSITHADHVTEQAAIAVDTIRSWLHLEANSRARRKHQLRPPRCGSPVALSAEEHLRRIDLDESHTLTVPKHDRVAVRDVVDADTRATRR